ncbi:AraC family transcriptional regulator [Pseudomonas shahriarae]|uniref:AraC family transcriptional regulator n=1 Tax=Pseudomonas shahriarae TaxID=2745512 RepID=UPI0016492542|nr:AraC family transcriptional regulator [Pseudomonas shahriarae]QXH86765.1 AraC family transcriptional regulator [Pseudomonas shahriarae]
MHDDQGSKTANVPQAAELSAAIQRFASTDGDFTTAFPALTMHRRHGVSEPMPCIYNLGIGVITQGYKQIMVGDKVHNYGPGQLMLSTFDMPVTAHVTRASRSEPLLGMMLKLDIRQIAQVAYEMELPSSPETAYEPISVHKLEPALFDAFLRLVRLLDEPQLVSPLAPLLQQEIVVRLLAGPQGSQLRHIIADGTPRQRMAQTLSWLRKNFKQALNLDDLAAHAHMTPSTFRQHFRDITGMSPLQFQKQMRLQEARQLMLNQAFDAGEASNLVGYESASQFSREYKRLFGSPPSRDIRRMRLDADVSE